MAAVFQPVVPAWVVPPAHAVTDLLTIAARHPADPWATGCHDAAEWITGWPAITYEQACEEMNQSLAERGDKHRAAVADTIAWLIGLSGYPPIRLPARNPDGSLTTAQQHYERLIADDYRPTPERRAEVRHQADLEYARSVRLAGLR